MATERVLFLFKPDVYARNIAGLVLARIEQKSFTILGLKLTNATQEQLRELYQEHVDKPFYSELLLSMSEHPIYALALEGPAMVKAGRMFIGSTDPSEALPGTIRGDFALSMPQNIVHCSDSVESGIREIAIFFKESELVRRPSTS